jgi:hypothetical protein
LVVIPKIAMSEICVLSSISKPTLPSWGWLMLPTTFCGSVFVYSCEYHMPAPRTVTLRSPRWLYWPRAGSGDRIFCSWRNRPAGIQTQLITPFSSSVTARWIAAVSSVLSSGVAPYCVIDVQPAGWLAAGATCSRSIMSMM